jgi:hypothetical protein
LGSLTGTLQGKIGEIGGKFGGIGQGLASQGVFKGNWEV